MLVCWISSCASAPRVDATAQPVGLQGQQLIRLDGTSFRVPASAFAHVELRWTTPDGRAVFELTGSGIGATLEALADREAESLMALEPEAAIEHERLRWLGHDARSLRTPTRTVLLAMRNPWRVARLFVRHTNARGRISFAGDGDQVGPFVLRTSGWVLESARFAGEDYVVELRQGEPAQSRRAPAGRYWLSGRGQLEGIWPEIVESIDRPGRD